MASISLVHFIHFHPLQSLPCLPSLTHHSQQPCPSAFGWAISLLDSLALSNQTIVSPGPDIAITDLSGLDVMHQIWGNCLGRAVCIRGFVRYRGFASLLPHDPEGGTQVHVQCEAAALERLKSASNFTRYG